MARHFKGEAGNIYVERYDDGDQQPYKVWFEEFCIIGQGKTETDALKDAVLYGTQISDLAARAIGELELR